MSCEKRKQERKKMKGTQLATIAGVLFLVGLVLVVKWQKPAEGSADTQNEIETVALTAGAVAPTQPVPTPTLLPEAQFDQWLGEGQPIFAFFHSTTCEQCVRMTEIVQQVYPKFVETVALVDVNVYDQRNGNLLQRAGIRVIPTLIFIDRAGQVQGYTGVMKAEALREQLQTMAEE